MKEFVKGILYALGGISIGIILMTAFLTIKICFIGG